MPTLLDTHAWVWWVTADRRLSSRARKAIATGVKQNDLWLSMISIWEACDRYGLVVNWLPEWARVAPKQRVASAREPDPRLSTGSG